MPAPARVAAVALTVLLVLGGVWAWGGTSVTQAATLAEVQGLVQVRLPGSATWQEALPGQALSAGCALRSSAGARVAVQYPDGSRSYLIGEAEVEIVNLSGRRDGRATSVQLSQAAGHTQHDMASAESSIQVESTGGAAQASAATYDVWVSDGEMDVAASRGQVTLGDGQEKTRLGAGQRGRVGHGRLKAATATPDPTATPQPTAEPQATPEAATPDTPEAEASPTPGKPGHGRQPTPGPAAKPTKDHTPPGQAKDKESPGQQKKARETTTPQLTPPSDEEGKRHN
ncbi:MAG TPA: hypothetical protein PLB78_15960 [Anaerolineae bacterium]|nr:hypothetical protein [Anaerolineae bacterium]